jgi:hypothetical protein
MSRGGRKHIQVPVPVPVSVPNAKIWIASSLLGIDSPGLAFCRMPAVEGRLTWEVGGPTASSGRDHQERLFFATDGHSSGASPR